MGAKALSASHYRTEIPHIGYPVKNYYQRIMTFSKIWKQIGYLLVFDH